ncbi:MAG: oligosaccharide flippase family protein [Pseudomonadota bacterium]
MTPALPRLTYLVFDGGMAARAIRTSGFTVIKFAGQNGLRLAGNLILTRLLFPEAFGMMALVQVVLAGSAMVSDFGIKGSIVQDRRGDDPDFLNTAWTLQILRGVLLGGVIVLGAAPIAAFYNTPALADLLLVAAAIPVIQGFTSTRLATASRHMAIGHMVGLHLGAQAAGIAVMIVLALSVGSVWALMLGTLVAPILVAVLSHIVLPGIRNRLRLEPQALRRMFNFGKYIFLATAAGFVIAQGDKAVLAKFVSLSDLAIYNIGFFLATVPALLAQRLSHAVMFPLYARRPPDAAATNRNKINQARRLITGGLLAGLICLSLIGDALIGVLYDARYAGAGPLLVLIALAAMPSLITASYVSLPLAAGHAGRYALLMVAGAVIQFTLVLLGAWLFGLVGVAIAPALAALIFYPILIFGVCRDGGWDPIHDLAYHAVAAVAAVAIIMIQWDLLAVLFASAGL